MIDPFGFGSPPLLRYVIKLSLILRSIDSISLVSFMVILEISMCNSLFCCSLSDNSDNTFDISIFLYALFIASL